MPVEEVGGDVVAGLAIHLHVQPLLVVQDHRGGGPLLHLHRISDALAVGGQHHGDQVVLAGILLAVRQVTVTGEPLWVDFPATVMAAPLHRAVGVIFT